MFSLAMLSKRKEIPIAIRVLVLQESRKANISYMKIAEKYALSKSTVQTIIRNFKNNGSIQNKPGRGKN